MNELLPLSKACLNCCPSQVVHYYIYFPQDIILSHFVDDATGYKWMFNHKKRDAETVRRIFNALKAKLESIRNHKTNEFLRLRKIRTDSAILVLKFVEVS